MSNKNIISRSIIVSSVFVITLLVLLTTYIGYRMPFNVNFIKLISEIRFYDDRGVLISKVYSDQINKSSISEGARAEIDLNFNNVFLNTNDFSLYLTTIQNPILITQDGQLIKEIGDFKNKKPQKEQDFLIDLKTVNFSKPLTLNIEKNLIKGSELDFIFNSGISENSKIANMQLAKSILVIYGYLAMSALFLSISILVAVIWLNASPYKYFGALSLSFFGQGWVALYFSRVWIQSLNNTLVNLSSFVIYFLSIGFLLLSFVGTLEAKNNFFSLKKSIYWPVIYYFASAFLILISSFQFELKIIMIMYKSLLTISLFVFGLFIIDFFIKCKNLFLQDRLMLTFTLIIILSGQINDILRVHSKIIFMYNVGPYAFFLGSLILIANAINILQQRFLRTLENEKYSAIYTITKQVAHDIRSPLSALNIITSSLTDVPEEKRLLIRNSVQRINDIANDLLQKGKLATNLSNVKTPLNDSSKDSTESKIIESNPTLNKNNIFLVPIVVDNIVSEKRIQFREKINVQINVDLKNSFGLFVNANPNELSRVISNLINNSVEALPNQSGNIEISVFSDNENNVCIQIKDNGRGIPKNVLSKLGQIGVTHGKENTHSGSGLGVYHAIKTIQGFGGQIQFQSVTADDLNQKINQLDSSELIHFSHVTNPELDTTLNSTFKTGTNITIVLPKATTPVWFAESIQLTSGQNFITVDDDISIHQIWKGRLQSLKSMEQNIKITSFTSAKEFRDYFNKNLKMPYLFLIDYEFLNQNDTGLKIIIDLGIQNNAILVTSRFDELNIRSECETQKIKIIPKQLAGQIPISILPNCSISTTHSVPIDKNKIRYDLCLVDDDYLIHSVWSMIAESKKLKIKLFENQEEFFAESASIDFSTPIYIDVSLGNNINGIDVAKVIYEKGFRNLNLATGYDPESIKPPAFINQIVGKEFPEING